MAYKKTAVQLFIDCAKEVYIFLTPYEKENISYIDFLDKTVEKYTGYESNESSRKTGYKYFKKYYDDHILNKNNEYKKPKNENLSYDYIQPLLEYDTRREKLLNTLGNEYRYYWFDKNVTYEDDSKQKRRFLILECATDITNDVYNVISFYFSDLFESVYLGFGGVVVIFDITAKTKCFDNFIEYIKKENKI